MAAISGSEPLRGRPGERLEGLSWILPALWGLAGMVLELPALARRLVRVMPGMSHDLPRSKRLHPKELHRRPQSLLLPEQVYEKCLTVFLACGNIYFSCVCSCRQPSPVQLTCSFFPLRRSIMTRRFLSASVPVI
jgi:hypothetical protein